MAGRELPALDRGQDVVGELQQAQGIGDRDAALADALCDLVLRVAAGLHEPSVAARLLDRIEVGALQILDEGQLQVLEPLGRAYHGGNGRESGKARCSKAPLAGDDAVAVAIGLNHERLQHPVRGDGVCEIPKVAFIEGGARLVEVG